VKEGWSSPILVGNRTHDWKNRVDLQNKAKN